MHTQYFASKLQACGRSFRHVSTDPDQRSLDSQQAYIDEAGLHDVVDTPLPLTLHSNGIQETSTDDQLADGSFDWMICINMVHISPWSATQGLIQTAAKKLKPGGYLFLYGPYRVGGACVESNLYVNVTSATARSVSLGPLTLKLTLLLNTANLNSGSKPKIPPTAFAIWKMSSTWPTRLVWIWRRQLRCRPTI